MSSKKIPSLSSIRADSHRSMRPKEIDSSLGKSLATNNLSELLLKIQRDQGDIMTSIQDIKAAVARVELLYAAAFSDNRMKNASILQKPLGLYPSLPIESGSDTNIANYHVNRFTKH